MLEFEPRGEKRTAHLLASGIQFSRSSASKDLWLTNQTTLIFFKGALIAIGFGVGVYLILLWLFGVL